jgi:hypothetical protein
LYLHQGFLANLANLALRICGIPRGFTISQGTNPTLSAILSAYSAEILRKSSDSCAENMAEKTRETFRVTFLARGNLYALSV